MTARLFRHGRSAALLAILALAACAPTKSVVPIVEIPPETRPEIRLGAVKVEYAIQTTYEESLRGHIIRKMEELVGECAAEGSQPHDFLITVTHFDHGDGGTAFLIGDSSTLRADIDVIPPGGGEPVGSYQSSVQIHGGGLLGIAIMADSQGILSGRLAGKVCEDMLGRLNPEEQPGREPGKRGGATNT